MAKLKDVRCSVLFVLAASGCTRWSLTSGDGFLEVLVSSQVSPHQLGPRTPAKQSLQPRHGDLLPKLKLVNFDLHEIV